MTRKFRKLANGETSVAIAGFTHSPWKIMAMPPEFGRDQQIGLTARSLKWYRELPTMRRRGRSWEKIRHSSRLTMSRKKFTRSRHSSCRRAEYRLYSLATGGIPASRKASPEARARRQNRAGVAGHTTVSRKSRGKRGG